MWWWVQSCSFPPSQKIPPKGLCLPRWIAGLQHQKKWQSQGSLPIRTVLPKSCNCINYFDFCFWSSGNHTGLLLSDATFCWKDLAAAAGIDVVEPQIQQGWHRGCGNGMIIGNIGMVLVAVLSSLKPTPKLEERFLLNKYVLVFK